MMAMDEAYRASCRGMAIPSQTYMPGLHSDGVDRNGSFTMNDRPVDSLNDQR